MAQSNSGVGTEDQGPSLNEFDKDTGQTTTGNSARGVSRDGHIGETVGHWGFEDDEPDEDDGRRIGRGRRTTAKQRDGEKKKKKKKGGGRR
jgi:hypothetical protein